MVDHWEKKGSCLPWSCGSTHQKLSMLEEIWDSERIIGCNQEEWKIIPLQERERANMKAKQKCQKKRRNTQLVYVNIILTKMLSGHDALDNRPLVWNWSPLTHHICTLYLFEMCLLLIEQISWLECDPFVTDGHFKNFKVWRPVKNKWLDVMVCFMIYCERYH